MELNELLKFIEMEDKRLIERFGSSNIKERILSRTVKLMEELGELSNEILAFNDDQRKEKLENYNKDNLENEFADVFIVLLLLARAMNINIIDAVDKKSEKIKMRYQA